MLSERTVTDADALPERQPVDAFAGAALPDLRRLADALTEGMRLSLGGIGARRTA